jgi:hypothetical protein
MLDPCEHSGHDWAPAGGGMLICTRCQAQKWDSERHVKPHNDLVPHVDDADCVCGPEVESVKGGWLVTHHALDGRA